ncbi:4,4'-diaponeurosporenoate glycosyltransferase [Gemmata sp. SH-PL17]|uniref:glycosyltransferase family 2 protein n=1 Tax=Gemmata sp. SH-PL17 TaxID=1630693 RepID=UPI00078C00A6|nr:glycosyltransferase family 2 protein [Gemmata sp. SH-PL17]AMV26706.1 4,4'-diaponeurosporenoate glycosyltransferase [Gemmata sp. SH-PL17]
MTLHALAWVALVCAAVPALLFLWNIILFREPAATDGTTTVPPISVLIPARNEELGIEACVRSVLASQHVELEVIVLDDASTDRTAELVRAIATTDARVRIEAAPSLLSGWSGKQQACFALSKLANYDTFTFLDADVRLTPDALARMALFLRASGADLVSGFPKQETGTLLEKLLIPFINWLLLCFLPLWGMRHFRWSAFGAGCGQWFMTTRAAYEKVGGHAAVKTSFHDGLTLPRAYRKAGFWTDVCDATNLATCRMYRSASGVWFGLAKNAREGMAATGQIGFWTVVLICGHVLPPALFVVVVTAAICGIEFATDPLDRVIEQSTRPFLLTMLGKAWFVSLQPRLHATIRFRQSWLGLLLHPVAILLLLAVQWYAIFRALAGKPVGWKGRTHPAHLTSREAK